MRSLFFVLLFPAVVALLKGSCEISDGVRQDCGYEGVDQAGCESKGCCWQESSFNDVP